MDHISERLIVKLEAQAEMDVLQKILESYLVETKITYQIETLNANDIHYWILIGQRKPFGFIELQRTEQGTINFWLIWVVYEHDTGSDKKERYLWMKGRYGLEQPSVAPAAQTAGSGFFSILLLTRPNLSGNGSAH